MRNRGVLVSLMLGTFFCVRGQDRTESFTLNLPESKVKNSLYKSIDCRDMRLDTSYFGVVQVGMLNTKVRVIVNATLQSQFQKVVDSYTDSSSKGGKLLFVVRRFTFKEVTRSTSETGYFYISGTLFAAESDRYRVVEDLDTIVEFKAMDVTQRLLRTVSRVLVDFVGRNLNAEPTDSRSYDYNDAVHIDSIRKLDFPLYTSTIYKDGLYNDYEAFKMQIPSQTVVRAVNKSNRLEKIVVADEAGWEQQLDKTGAFAIVIGGKPYISTGSGFYMLEKDGDDFYYTGKTTSYDPGLGVMFGLAGALLAGTRTENARFKLDYKTGIFLFAESAK